MNRSSPDTDWSRLDIQALVRLRERWLCRGGAWKADLSLVRNGPAQAVLKDFTSKSALVRWIGRFQVSREAHVYAALSGLQGVPRLLARPSPESLLLSYIEGRRLSKERGVPDASSLAEKLEQLIEQFHLRGVAHVDLRGRDNILVDGARQVWVLDFGASWRRTPGGPMRRWLFSLGRRVDRAAILKWRLLLAPDSVSPRERRRMALFQKWRRLWFLNPKGKSKAHGSSR
ncbi:MAG: hypothetical protein O7F16_00315 [Acidobacteria bacterium]|nr:hypothetical protein [Acidobacteriota bacterium]